MATKRQIEAAKRNIKKAQAAWKSMSHAEHARAQPEGRRRAKPGSTGEGEFYRIVVREKGQFETFRNQDVGSPGHVERLAGRRPNGSWDTESWLISKKDAHMEGKRLVADSDEAREVLDKLGSKPVHVKGDVFKAHDRPNVPEADKPTRAQTRARAENIKKAQAARWRRG